MTVDGEVSARERIRRVALELYSEHGEDRVSMRRVASASGVTIGLIQHHFGTKDGLRLAVDELVLEHVTGALATVDHTGTPTEVVASRDTAVRSMMESTPTVVKYINRALLDTDGRGTPLLESIVDLTAREVQGLRSQGYASTRSSDKVQIVRTIMGQVGELFLEPVVDAVWSQVGGAAADRPAVRITIEER